MSEFVRFDVKAARDFANKYATTTRENSMSQSFWGEFFRSVCGIHDLTAAGIEFEFPVRSKSSGQVRRVDVLWSGVVLIEQKSMGEDLAKAELQARDYLVSLDPSIRPPAFIVSDFKRIRVYEVFSGDSVEFNLTDLPKHLGRFESIIGDNGIEVAKVQTQADLKAAKLMANLFVQFERAGYSGHQVSVLLVRVLFLLFGEDTRMFKPTTRGLFTDFVEASVPDGSGLGARLQELFQVLDTPESSRPLNLPSYVKDFPYVNGGLFRESIGIFAFTKGMREALLEATTYDWSQISPAIFGSLFQSARDKETRREMGEHFTPEEFILRSINDLFLNDLNGRLTKAWDNPKALQKLRAELGTYNFLDPACGSGNFLLVTYKKLRELELKIIARNQELTGSVGQLQIDGSLGLQVHLGQFHGIELDDWSSSIAVVAMHLADHQANLALEEITGVIPARFPLNDSAQIVQGNALRLDWAEICPMGDKTFIIGNPPFNGARYQSEDQRADTLEVWQKVRGMGEMDYVANWHLVASRLISKHGVEVSFVSTNSITQGEQPAILWSQLRSLGVEISFAHQTFQWQNEASGQAAVHVVIMGLCAKTARTKKLWTYPNIKGKPVLRSVREINGYLVDAPDILISSRSRPISQSTARMDFGSMANDKGYLSNIDAQEAEEIRKTDPIASKYLRRIVGSQEFLNNKERYCLWLVGANPSDIRQSKVLSERVQGVRDERLKSKRSATKKLANRPAEFGEVRQPESGEYLLVPRTSSERREYVPIGFFDHSVIANDSVLIIPGAKLLDFGVLSSRLFNVWLRSVSGRLKSDFRISATITYNNFPFVQLPIESEADISNSAQVILDLRDNFSSSSLADLYDPNSMPGSLRSAHEALDRDVLKAFGLKPSMTDNDILTRLFELYEGQSVGLD